MKIRSWDEHFIRSIFISAALALALIGCGGGGGGGTGTTSYSVGGTVSGLVGSGSVVLRENISDNNLTVTTNGTYTFTVQVASGSAYLITVLTQPAGQTCTISGGTGIISGNVMHVDVACTDNPFTVGGTVTGLTGSVKLQNNGGDDLTVTNGPFTFATKLVNGSAYKVTADLSQNTTSPQTCSVSSGAGTVSGNVTDVTVVCSPTAYTVSVTVTGPLNGSAVLQVNDDDDLTVTNGGPFPFAKPVAKGSPYYVTLRSLQFPNQICTITGDSSTGGVTLSGDVTVAVDCKKNTTPRFAYVANSSANTVSAYTIDANSGALTGVGTVATGTNPYSVTVDPSGKFAYVANNGSNDVSAYTIDGSGALTPVGTVAAGTLPSSVTVDPTGKFAYVANGFDGVGGNSVSAYKINASTGALTPVGTVATGTLPSSVTVDPSGQFVYVANFNSNDVSAYTINSTTGALTEMVNSPFGAGTGPGSVTVDPSGTFAYVANWGSDDVSAYAIDGAGALTPIICSGITCIGNNFPAGSLPNSVTVDPSGKFVYVANWSSGPGSISAYAIDGAGALTPIICSGITCIGNNFPAGTGPFSVTVDPSGKFVYVANQISADVSAYAIDGAGALTPIICSGITCIGNNFPAGTDPFSITTTIH